MLERDYKMVKKWYKPRGKSMVLIDEEEIDKILIKHLEQDEKKVTKKNVTKEKK